MEERQPMKVAIVGGSLAGLMHGIMLRSLGHDVSIIEKTDDIRESHMAGVCCAWDCQQFLEKFDRISTPFTLQSDRLQFLKTTGEISNYFKIPRRVTSWDAYYWRLRANFDGWQSDFYPDPPPKEFPGAGPGVFLSCHEVHSLDDQDDHVVVGFECLNDGRKLSMKADLVLGADGPSSFTRALYLPDCHRQYSGYVAWRGTIPESLVSEETVKVFEKNVTLNLMSDDHALIYIIPGEKGSLVHGERFLNFLWYTNHSQTELEDIMKDCDGHVHAHLVPRGKVHPEQWKKQLKRSHLLCPPHREVMENIEVPFVQSITDFTAPRAAFANGKILLVGDSLSLYRPHTASSANNAAFDCLMVERLVQGQISVEEWNQAVLEFAKIHWARSVWFGENYQRPLLVALPSAFRYWIPAGWNMVRSMLTGAAHKLRW